MNKKRYMLLPLLMFPCSFSLQCQDKPLEKVEASDFFDVNAGPIVYIETADSQVLVFNANKNEQYVLHGRPLEIHAKTIELTGDVMIRSFAQTEHGSDTAGTPPTESQLPQKPQGQGSGDNGQPGDPGHPGAAGAIGGRGDPSDVFRLYLWSSIGQGTITFNSSGMRGGKGQTGGKGQNGQQGGKGHDRGSSDSPGDGGNGGDGGVGGQGGPGGPGGRGGKIIFDHQTCLLKSVRLISPESDGGDPGSPGKGGASGGHGDGGGGYGTFGDTSGGHPGLTDGTDRHNQDGPKGVTGVKGASGEISCSDCAKPIAIGKDGKLDCPGS